MRLWKGFKIFDVPALMAKIKVIYKEKGEKAIKRNPVMAEDTASDNNKIVE